jgi:hypothetical protein
MAAITNTRVLPAIGAYNIAKTVGRRSVSAESSVHDSLARPFLVNFVSHPASCTPFDNPIKRAKTGSAMVNGECQICNRQVSQVCF